jgi:hypothetical protein
MLGRRPAAARPAGDPSLPVYLSLFLLLAALFLLLNSLSPREARRAQAAVGSVAQAFGSKSRPETPRDAPGMRWAEATGAALAEQLPLGALTTATHERGARFALTSETLFANGQANLRGERVAMIDRLVDQLRHPPAGSRATLEVRLAAGDSLAAPRAETLARALIGRGLEPAIMAVGVASGGAHTVELLVATRAETRR